MSECTFAERHSLWSDEQARLAKEVSARIKFEGLESIRLSFPDQHGLLRGKTLMAGTIADNLGDGCALTTTLLLKDTSHRTEFHIFRIVQEKLKAAESGHPGMPPDVELMAQGYQYLTETRYDELEPVLELIQSNLAPLELPLRSMEVEFGPSQVEFTFGAQDALATADAMILFRSAVKQVC